MAAITSTFNKFDSATLDENAKFGTTPATISVSGIFGSIKDLGAAANGHYNLYVDVSTALATAGNAVILTIQGGNASDLSDAVCLGAMPFGDLTVTGEAADNAGNEKLILPFNNNREGTVFRYLRVWCVVVGSGTLIVNQAFYTQRPA